MVLDRLPRGPTRHILHTKTFGKDHTASTLGYYPFRLLTFYSFSANNAFLTPTGPTYSRIVTNAANLTEWTYAFCEDHALYGMARFTSTHLTKHCLSILPYFNTQLSQWRLVILKTAKTSCMR